MGNFHLLYLGKKALGLGKYMARKSGLPCAFRPKSLGLTNPLNIYCFFPKHSPVLVQMEMRFKWDRFVKSSLYFYISSFSVQNKNDIWGVCFSNVLTPFALSPISKPSSWLRTRHISLSLYLYPHIDFEVHCECSVSCVARFEQGPSACLDSLDIDWSQSVPESGHKCHAMSYIL